MEVVVPARIHCLESVDPGEIRRVQLALPEHITIEGTTYVMKDSMRPGTAFLTKPWGSRTQKPRRRMYTRSNIASTEPGILETFINDTHSSRSDTSAWWQSEDAYEWYVNQKPLEVRVTLDPEIRLARVYENTMLVKPANLRLEEDGVWERMPMILVAFGTGVTPFLSYVRYMARHWANTEGSENPAPVILIASARHEQQLILHDELLTLADTASHWFRYHPVLTRTWPDDWGHTRGRMLRDGPSPENASNIDLSPFLELVSDPSKSHLRLCGNSQACQQLVQGLSQLGITPMSIRSESW